MKTEDLVSLLATGAEPVSPHAVGRRFALALLVTLPLITLVMLFTLGLRADLGAASAELPFWTKLAFTACLALAAMTAADRLARPGTPMGLPVWAVLAGPLVLMGLAAGATLMQAPLAQWPTLFWGQSWRTCPATIVLLSIPLLAATLWAMHGLAPTRPALAGAGCGLLSGALAASVYALHCPESSALFLVTWYVLGMGAATAAGAVLGARVLRW